MKILITGYGKMGRMVEELAQQKGWEILAALDGQDAKLLRQLKKADAAVDFPIQPCWIHWPIISAVLVRR